MSASQPLDFLVVAYIHIHVAFDAVYFSLGGVLPHLVVALVQRHTAVFRKPDTVIIIQPVRMQIIIVPVAACIYPGLITGILNGSAERLAHKGSAIGV